MRAVIIGVLLVAMVMFSGCGKDIPRNVINPDKMEKVLYDYQKASVMNDQLAYEDTYKKDLLLKSVFEKHRITQAEFDSSLVWYARHATLLAEMYAHIDARLEKERDIMHEMVKRRTNEVVLTQSGDTVDIWRGNPLYLLSSNELNNRVDFSIPYDTCFHVKDAFCWNVDFIFLTDRFQKATMGMSVVYENDSVVGKTMDITKSGNYQVYLKSDSAFQVSHVSGFIYLYPEKDKRAGILLNHVSLTRYHQSLEDSIEVENVTDIVDGQDQPAPEQANKQ